MAQRSAVRLTEGFMHRKQTSPGSLALAPAHPPAAHVQAAVARAAQAKLPQMKVPATRPVPAPPGISSARIPAPHLQAAMARAAQAKLPERTPSPAFGKHPGERAPQAPAATAPGTQMPGRAVPARARFWPASSKAAVQLSSTASASSSSASGSSGSGSSTVKAKKKDDSEKKKDTVEKPDLTKSFKANKQAAERTKILKALGLTVNKSHGSHGSNFSKTQTLEEILADVLAPFLKSYKGDTYDDLVKKVKEVYGYTPK